MGNGEAPESEVLAAAGPEFLHLSLHDVRYIKLAFSRHFRQEEEHLGQGQKLPEEFYFGYKQAVIHVWKALLTRKQRETKSLGELEASTTWKEFRSLDGAVQREIGAEFEKDLASFAASKEGSLDLPFAPLIGKRIHRPRLSLDQRLDEKFLHYPVRIVDEEYSGQATTGFLVAVKGVVQHIPGKVKVIRFVHPVFEGNSFGYAVLLYSPNFVWNYSQWWLFHDFCDDFDTMGNSSRQIIENVLTALKARLAITSFKIGADDLFEYVRTHPRAATKGLPEELAYHDETESLSGMRRLLARSEESQRVAKGIALELIALQLESRKGNQARWRFRPKSLGKEFDVFGVKTEEGTANIHLIECTTDWEEGLVSELDGKIALVEECPPETLSEFHLSDTTKRVVTSSIITTDALDPDMEREQGAITILDREALKAICISQGIGWPDVLDRVFPQKKFVPTMTIRSFEDFRKAFADVFEKDD